MQDHVTDETEAEERARLLARKAEQDRRIVELEKLIRQAKAETRRIEEMTRCLHLMAGETKLPSC